MLVLLRFMSVKLIPEPEAPPVELPLEADALERERRALTTVGKLAMPASTRRPFMIILSMGLLTS
jgi:hypothetical protein